MNDVEMLAELVGDIARDLRPEIEPLSIEQLAWEPGPQANSIGVTLWHIARGLDFLGTRVVHGKSTEDELWHTNGWREKTGYDPRGLGYGGWGVVTGYTWEQVQDIPKLSAGELLQYLDEAIAALAAAMGSLTSESARQPVPELMGGRLTYFRWIKEFYKGFQAYVGEIVAIKAQMEKAGR